MKIDCAKMETCAITAEHSMVEVEQKMPKRLDRAVEEYKGSASFDIDVDQVWCSTFMVVYSWIERDMKRYFPDFDLVRLQ